MANVYLTFSGAAYHATTSLIVDAAPALGADRVVVADDAWLLKTEFYRRNKWLWDPMPRYYLEGWHERPIKFGFGWCAWKAYVIRCVLERLNPGDVVCYTDADTYPIADLRPIFEYARDCGMVLFEEQGADNGRWTKMSCFLAMGIIGPPSDFRYQNMACGRFQLFQRCYSTLDFLSEWEEYSVDARCQRWDRGEIELPEFARHSCEQSVLSNLAYTYSVPLHRTPDQNGGALAGTVGHVAKDWDLYPQLFRQQYCMGDRDDLSGSRFANIEAL